MRAPWMRALAFVSSLATSGCTLLISAELSNKPTQTDGGGGGQGGSGSSSSSAGPSSSSGVVCPPGMANCDGIAADGCDVNLMNDPDNCGSCNVVCTGALRRCVGGNCR